MTRSGGSERWSSHFFSRESPRSAWGACRPTRRSTRSRWYSSLPCGSCGGRGGRRVGRRRHAPVHRSTGGDRARGSFHGPRVPRIRGCEVHGADFATTGAIAEIIFRVASALCCEADGVEPPRQLRELSRRWPSAASAPSPRGRRGPTRCC